MFHAQCNHFCMCTINMISQLETYLIWRLYCFSYAFKFSQQVLEVVSWCCAIKERNQHRYNLPTIVQDLYCVSPHWNTVYCSEREIYYHCTVLVRKHISCSMAHSSKMGSFHQPNQGVYNLIISDPIQPSCKNVCSPC